MRKRWAEVYARALTCHQHPHSSDANLLCAATSLARSRQSDVVGPQTHRLPSQVMWGTSANAALGSIIGGSCCHTFWGDAGWRVLGAHSCDFGGYIRANMLASTLASGMVSLQGLLGRGGMASRWLVQVSVDVISAATFVPLCLHPSWLPIWSVCHGPRSICRLCEGPAPIVKLGPLLQ